METEEERKRRLGLLTGKVQPGDIFPLQGKVQAADVFPHQETTRPDTVYQIPMPDIMAEEPVAHPATSTTLGRMNRANEAGVNIEQQMYNEKVTPLPTQGKYSRMQAEFIASDEGKKMQADLDKQIEDSLQKQADALDKAEAQRQLAIDPKVPKAWAKQAEEESRPMFQGLLEEIGVPENEAKEVRGIDPEVLNRIREHKKTGVAKNIYFGEEGLFGKYGPIHNQATQLGEVLVRLPYTIGEAITTERQIQPFPSLPYKDGGVVPPMSFSGIGAVGAELLNETEKAISNVVLNKVPSLALNLFQKAMGVPKEERLPWILTIPGIGVIDQRRFGVENEMLGETHPITGELLNPEDRFKAPEIFTQMLRTSQALDKAYPDTPVTNAFYGYLAHAVPLAMDAWIAGDVFAGVGNMMSNAVFKTTEAAGVRYALMNIGGKKLVDLAADVTAAKAKGTLSKEITESYTEQLRAIWRADSPGATKKALTEEDLLNEAVGDAVIETYVAKKDVYGLAKAIMQMGKEGRLSAESQVKLIKLQTSIKILDNAAKVTGKMARNSPLIGASNKFLENIQNYAMVTNTPIKSMADLEELWKISREMAKGELRAGTKVHYVKPTHGPWYYTSGGINLKVANPIPVTPEVWQSKLNTVMQMMREEKIDPSWFTIDDASQIIVLKLGYLKEGEALLPILKGLGKKSGVSIFEATGKGIDGGTGSVIKPIFDNTTIEGQVQLAKERIEEEAMTAMGKTFKNADGSTTKEMDIRSPQIIQYDNIQYALDQMPVSNLVAPAGGEIGASSEAAVRAFIRGTVTNNFDPGTVNALNKQLEDISKAVQRPASSLPAPVSTPTSKIENLIFADKNVLAVALADAARSMAPANFLKAFPYATGENATGVSARGVFNGAYQQIRDTNNTIELGKELQLDVPINSIDFHPANVTSIEARAKDTAEYAPGRIKLLDSGELSKLITTTDKNADQIRTLEVAARGLGSLISVLERKGEKFDMVEMRKIFEKGSYGIDRPTLFLKSNGRLGAVNASEHDIERIEAAKLLGYETLPARIIDMHGDIAAFQEALKAGAGPHSLSTFASHARAMEPRLATGEYAKHPDVIKFQADQQGIANGTKTRIGTDVDNIVINSREIRTQLPEGTNVFHTGLLWRERFVPRTFRKAGEGSNRTVDARDGIAIKIAHSERGFLQNIQAFNLFARNSGIIPKVIEAGEDYIVFPEIPPLQDSGKMMVEKFKYNWEVWLGNYRKENPDIVDTKEFHAKAWADFGDALFQSDLYNIDNILPNGEKMIDFDALLKFRPLVGDLHRPANWGQLPSGKMVLLDEGTLDAAIFYFGVHGKHYLEVTSDDFIKIKARMGEVKKANGDIDPNKFFAAIPVPGVTEDDDGNGYDVDPFRSAFMTMMGGILFRGKGGKGFGDLFKKPSSPISKGLPKLKVPVILASGLSKTSIMNSEVDKAITGEAFGGIMMRATGGKADFAGKVETLDTQKTHNVFGDDAAPAFFDRDTAGALGKLEFVAQSADNPLVIKTDDEMIDLMIGAGIDAPNFATGWEKTTLENISKLRQHVENTLGHDGVIIKMDEVKGAVALKNMFQYDQMISFNPANRNVVTDPKRQYTRTAPTKAELAAQAKNPELQRKLLIEPPERIINITEKQMLNNRLILMNQIMKTGLKMGAAETRVAITNQLRNSYEFEIQGIKRDAELDRLRVAVQNREIALIQKEIFDYMKQVLPVEEHGRFVKMIMDAKTRTGGKLIPGRFGVKDGKFFTKPGYLTKGDLVKVVLRIDKRVEQLASQKLDKDIIGLAKKIIEGKYVSADYRAKARDLLGDIDLKKRRPSTIRKAQAFADYLKGSEELGEASVIMEGEANPQLAKHLADMLEIISKKPLSSMSLTEKEMLLEELETIELIGKTKKNAVEAKYQRDLARAEEAVLADLAPIEKHPIIKATEKDNLELTTKDAAVNLISGVTNSGNSTGLFLTPTDTVFDLLGGGKGTYAGGPYRIFKAQTDVYYGRHLDDIREIKDDVQKLIDKHKLKMVNFNRMGIYAIAKQGGAKRLLAQGVTQKAIDWVLDPVTGASKLKPGEQELVDYALNLMESQKPRVAQMARELFNIELKEVEGYSSFMIDYASMGDAALADRWGSEIPMMGDVTPAKGSARYKIMTEKGYMMGRNAGAMTPLRLNFVETFLQHETQFTYANHLARHVKMLGQIKNGEKFKALAGDLGNDFTSSWVDVMARMGGAAGQQQMVWLDILRSNYSIAQLAWKLSAIVIQPTAAVMAMAVREVGAFYVMKGSAVVTASKGAREFLSKNFPKLRERAGGDISFAENVHGKIKSWLADKGYIALRATDMRTASGVTLGAYYKFMKENGRVVDFSKPADLEGVAYAERWMTLTQGSGHFPDLPLVFHGKGLTGNRSANRALLSFQTPTLFNWSLMRNNIMLMGLYRGETMADKAWSMQQLLMWLAGITAATGSGVVMQRAFMSEDEKAKTSVPEMFAIGFTGAVPLLGSATSIAVYQSNPVPSFNATSLMFKGGAAALTGKESDTRLSGVVDFTAGAGAMAGYGGTMQLRQILKASIKSGGSGSKGGGAPSIGGSVGGADTVYSIGGSAVGSGGTPPQI